MAYAPKDWDYKGLGFATRPDTKKLTASGIGFTETAKASLKDWGFGEVHATTHPIASGGGETGWTGAAVAKTPSETMRPAA